MRRILGNLIFLAVLGTVAYVYRGPLSASWSNIYGQFFPCTKPLEYSIGSFDKRFGISEAQFLKAIGTAEAVWEKPAGKELFAYTADGRLKMNLIFDYRQEATIRLRELGLSVEDSQSSYDALTARLAALKRAFEQRDAAYTSLVADVKRRNDEYNAQVRQWNRKKGAPKDVYKRLNAEAAVLKREVEHVRAMEAELQRLVADINALISVINRVANNINASAEEYNRIGKERGEEFTEGLFTSDRTGQQIDIYQFNDTDTLVRVLAHELGHALRLEHVEDPKAIMYRLNQGTNAALTAADIAALKKQCRIE